MPKSLRRLSGWAILILGAVSERRSRHAPAEDLRRESRSSRRKQRAICRAFGCTGHVSRCRRARRARVTGQRGTLPSGFSQTTVTPDLGLVTAMAFAPDGRLFVTTQGGVVRILKNGTLLPTPFLSIKVDPRGERGLTGIAFDPAFATNGYVYLHYTVPGTPAHNRVSRFVAQGDVAQSVNGVPVETRLLELDPLGTDSLIHNSGAMAFGPDGKLYVTVGDNGASANAQSLTSRLGKVLRIGADGSIPVDNPFISKGATGANRAIWAIGLRNPFSFDISPPARCSSTTSGKPRGRRSTTGSPAPTTAGPRRKARRPTPDSGRRSSPTGTPGPA